MKRRRALQIAAAGGLAIVGLGGGGAAIAVRTRKQSFLQTFAEVESWLGDHAAAEPKTTGAWPFATVLGHVAQSIELTLRGFPELKSAAFRSTVGSAAFGVFSVLGGTRHGLSELIPGTERADVEAPFEKNLERLRAAIAAFRAHTGELHPHFAYGALSREQAERAHAMHFSEHLSEVVS